MGMSDVIGGVTTRPLGEVAKVYSGGTPSRSVARYWGGTVPWVSTAEIGESTIVTTAERITEDGLRNSAARVAPAGTLLMAMYGQGKTRGKTAILGIPAAMNQACAAIEPHAEVNPRFLLHYLQAHYDDVRNLSNSGSQENLSGTIVKQIPIRYPLLAEQERIAAVLDDAAAAVVALERVIAKKRAIKQGMMQELLTGRTRLPGFSGEWGADTLGSVSRVKTGSRNNQDKDPSGAYPFFVRSATVERIGTYSYDTEAILVPGEGGIGSIFHYIDGKFEVHQRVYKISDFSRGIAGKFVYYYMRQFFGPYALENSVKATVDSLRLPTFRSFELRFPPSRAEQLAVVEVLEDAGSEIDILEHHLRTARAIKQGMMQELLTGRTRLVPTEALV